jgi:hypothetical protein
MEPAFDFAAFLTLLLEWLFALPTAILAFFGLGGAP